VEEREGTCQGVFYCHVVEGYATDIEYCFNLPSGLRLTLSLGETQGRILPPFFSFLSLSMEKVGISGPCSASQTKLVKAEKSHVCHTQTIAKIGGASSSPSETPREIRSPSTTARDATVQEIYGRLVRGSFLHIALNGMVSAISTKERDGSTPRSAIFPHSCRMPWVCRWW
jgi:hypothetical protein